MSGVLRGYEVARELPDGVYERMGAFKATDLARRQALADAAWLNDRFKAEHYVVRALVSVPLEVMHPPEPGPAPTEALAALAPGEESPT